MTDNSETAPTGQNTKELGTIITMARKNNDLSAAIGKLTQEYGIVPKTRAITAAINYFLAAPREQRDAWVLGRPAIKLPYNTEALSFGGKKYPKKEPEEK